MNIGLLISQCKIEFYQLHISELSVRISVITFFCTHEEIDMYRLGDERSNEYLYVMEHYST